MPNLKKQSSDLDTLGKTHVHVDGPRGVAPRIKSFIDEAILIGLRSRYSLVSPSIKGIQWGASGFEDMYRVHTPGQEGLDEPSEFGGFSTTEVLDRDEVDLLIGLIRHQLSGVEGIVIEMEQTVAEIDAGGHWNAVPEDQIQLPSLFPTEEEGTGPDIEIHHTIKIPKSDIGRDSPLPFLGRLSGLLSGSSIEWGQWFPFDSGDDWAFTSNAFTYQDETLRVRVEEEYRELKRILSEDSVAHSLSTQVEHILGIVRSIDQFVPRNA
ncbi:MAG: hypothetical protein Q8P27_03380 [Candidatus Peregrinibacteria bacterium]|nr:hypothetical protein [Candidatus Peregrinibacteria bacterium]